MAQLRSDAKSGGQEGDLKSTPFENILNFRDVGKTINEFLGERYFMFARGHREGLDEAVSVYS